MKKTLVFIWAIVISQMLFGQSGNNYWKPDVNKYPTNMSVIAVVSLSEVEQRDAMIELGAFYSSDNELNGELRGSKRLAHIQTQNGAIDRYMAHITIYGNAGDVITFRLYNHELGKELSYITEQTITFVVDGTIGKNDDPYVIDFSKNVVSTSDLNELSATDNAVINGDVIVEEGKNIAVNDLTINSSKSLTIQKGGIVTVNGMLCNTNADALIIEEGGQLVHYNEGVAATFKNEIVTPNGTWGEDDITGWQFISSPIENVDVNDFIPTSGDYDLYMYDGTQEHQWVNFKQMGSTLYDFSTNPFNNGWTAIDADGDGQGWKYSSLSKYVYSVSVTDEDVYSPKNYFISPQISVKDGTSLNFKARVNQVVEDIPETFKILLSEKSNTIEDFTEVYSYSITNNTYQEFTIELSSYVGKNIYIAFYHYVSGEYGSGQLRIDDVEFKNENSFEKGRGYLVSYQNAENVAEFKGDLNYLAKDASYDIPVKYYSGNDNLMNIYLIGNPFVFDINWEEDIQFSGLFDGFAVLDSKSGSYMYNNNIIKAGEGFMVKATEGVGNYVRFSKGNAKSRREISNSINVVASNAKGSDNVVIRFADENSGFPKLTNFNEKIANVYVSEEDVNYGIYTYTPETTEIPLHFDAKEIGNYTLTFDIDGDYDNLYLIDKMSGEKVNLLIENEYSFMANSTDATDRFVIKMDNSQQTTDNSHFAYLYGEDLIINVEGSIQIIDMMGRVVMTEENHNGSINISELNNAAYIVRCVNENEVRTQKIVVL